VTDIDIGINYS